MAEPARRIAPLARNQDRFFKNIHGQLISVERPSGGDRMRLPDGSFVRGAYFEQFIKRKNPRYTPQGRQPETIGFLVEVLPSDIPDGTAILFDVDDTADWLARQARMGHVGAILARQGVATSPSQAQGESPEAREAAIDAEAHRRLGDILRELGVSSQEEFRAIVVELASRQVSSGSPVVQGAPSAEAADKPEGPTLEETQSTTPAGKKWNKLQKASGKGVRRRTVAIEDPVEELGD